MSKVGQKMRGLALMSAATGVLIPAVVWSQSLPAETPKNSGKNGTAISELEEVVVTGTLLRNSAPVGSSVITVGQESVASTGAMSTTQLLASIPQVANLFNTVPSVALGNANQVQVIRPNLRNLPGGQLATGAATLILIDGHRVAGVGVSQAAVDPDLVPTGAIERVEIVTDGGSSTYGADAVGGVINFITRRRFDGVQIDARRGFADEYHTFDANLTAGKDWGSGSAYISYNYAKNDAIFGRDRDYIKRLDYSVNPPVPTGRSCDVPNVQIGSVFYALPSLLPNTFNSCDLLKESAIVPDSERHGVFAGLSQDLNDAIKLDVRAFYAKRDTDSAGGPATASVTVRSTNPYYRPISGNPTANQQVSFNFRPVPDSSSLSSTHFDEDGISAEVTADLTSNWQLRTLLNYSESKSRYFLKQINPTLLNQYAAGTTTATAINPYDIGSTQNQQLVADLLNWQLAGESKDELLNARSILDGSLFSLPGGEVRVALGVEFSRDEFEQRFGENARGRLGDRAFVPYDREVKSAFGEVQVPIVGKENSIAAVDLLVLSASARYDDYSDFGDTFNPKFGITYNPVEWLSIHGNWGQSFNAPTSVDQLGSLRNTILAVPFAAAVPTGSPNPPFGSVWTVAVQGSANDLKPQTADTWSVGFDIDYPFLEGLHSAVSYYDIYFKGVLDKPPVQTPQLLFQNFPSTVTLNPTSAQIAAYGQLAANSGGPAQVAQFLAGPGSPVVYELIDFRTNNYGNTKLSGLDFSTSYIHQAGFGSVDASVSGNYQLKSDTQATSNALFLNDLRYNNSRLRVQTVVGASIGDFRAQATWNYNSGYDVVRAANLPQDTVSSFSTADLFFRYNLNGEKLLSGVTLTLNVNNVLDEEPPVYRVTGGNGYTNGFSVGRLFILGASKKF
jgi:iron complex outermembrane receptor protein